MSARGPLMRFLAVLLAVMTVSACGSRNGGSQPDRERTTSEAIDAESPQGRAWAAGRALVGKAAPAAILRTIDGQTIELGNIYGRKPVYLKFWATWCVPCRQQMPGFEADYEKLRDRMVTVAVNTGFNDDVDAVRAYRREHGLTMPIVIDDGSLGGALNLRVTPQHVVIGRDGRILYVGQLADDRLHTALQQAIAERPAQQPLDKAVEAPDTLDPQVARTAGFPLTGAAADGKPRILVFFASWCETYLKPSRPGQAEACKRIREDVNRIAESGSAHWLGIASRLWTTNSDFEHYRASKNAYRVPLYLDASGALFRAFQVQQFPTIVILDRSGRVAQRLGPQDRDLSQAIRKATRPA